MNTKNGNILIRTLFLSLLFMGVISCDFTGKEKKQLTIESLNEDNFAYNLKAPNDIYFLPNNLKEISGISFYKKNQIVCINDEKANIYIFDTEKREIISKYDFGKKGDYEDIAVVKDDVFILRSDGTLFKVENFETNQRKTTKIKTLLTKKNNTEGLFFDENTNSLLIACKNSPSINKNEPFEGFKAIYRFDLNTNTLIEKPEYLVNFSKIDSLKVTGAVQKLFIKTAKQLKFVGDGNRFHPSGLGIHPIEKDKIYVISSLGKWLIVMSISGEIINFFELDKQIFSQPEGICFSENGDLYISNEGKNGKANILQFKINMN
ncbi:MAG: hypothetical protein HN778_07745 [Prolixibacteraceae bacterium]|jgi:uncharacterized protein YjiK|nr:hypothetical protein [Prolixibacteraceae bacterium]MBT6765987.1 hypothetical protein [Prolixibacteraceae bacterium]MBT6997298.1 hypothetical protein [Prolixibacteraceae bacterium]MBT7394710.1 hypothetical protein [Prolixibacteraceae bacterium]